MTKRIAFLLVAALLMMSVGLFAGCNDGDDPAEAMLQSGGSTASTPPPAATETPAETEAATAGAAAEGAAAEGAATEGEAAEGAATEGEAAEGAATEGEAADGAATEGEAADGAATEGEAAEDGAATEDEAPADDTAEEDSTIAGETETTGDAESEAGADELIEDEAPAVSDDPIENFKNLDPRDIITRKYEDMESRKTEPWNDEDPENFIPRTGRVDPMTRVWDSVPDELKPPRAGETDQNDITSYLVASEATEIVNNVARALQCHNVIQVGLERYATFSVGGSQFILQEGQNFQQGMGSSTGVTIILGITVSSIDTDEVTVEISATGQGTNVTISKSVVYIPAS